MLEFLSDEVVTKRRFDNGLAVMVNYIVGVYRRYGVEKVDFRRGGLEWCSAYTMRMLMAYQDPSPFKVAAALTIQFTIDRPVLTPLPTDRFGALHIHSNAILGFLLSRQALAGARLCTTHGDKWIKNRIVLSDHFFEEFVHALGRCTQYNQFTHEMIALVYEGLAYRANPKSCYLSTQGKSRYLL